MTNNNVQVTYAGQQQQTIASLEVAEMVGKQHGNVMRDIRKIKDDLGQLKIEASSYFTESTYKNSQNKTQPMFLLTKQGCELYGNRMTGIEGTAFAVKYVERFNEMEEAMKPSYMISDPVKRAEKWIEEQKQLQLLELENNKKDQVIGELKPKADYTDRILQSDGLMTITQIAKDYGMSGQSMNALLKKLGVQYRQAGQWLLYSKHHAKGYTHSDTIEITHSDGRPGTKLNTKWTQKGRLFLYELLKKQNISPIIEQFDVKQEVEA